MVTATLERPTTTTASAPSIAQQAPTSAPARRRASAGHTAALDRRGRNCVAQFLARRGHEILECDWASAFGTADIITRDEGVIVFVEVNVTDDPSQGFPDVRMDQVKRDRFERMALAYLSDNEVCDATMRLDVVSVVPMSSDRAMIRHHINALGTA